MRKRRRSSHYTRPLHGYSTEKLPPPSKGEQFIWLLGRIKHVLRRFYRRKIKQPLIAVLGLGLGFGCIYLGFNLQADGPVRQHTVALLKKIHIDISQEKLQSLGDEIKRSAENSVLTDNMKRTRVMLEAYPVEGGGYPETVQELINRAKQEGYWALYKNPLTRARQENNIIIDFSVYSSSLDKEKFAGVVLYEPIGKYDYRIYACDRDGHLFKTKNEPYYLTRP